ncbi:MAG: hypothetical protein A4E40_00095 [Methanoregulaceae archaeon PtaU1.Bin059]|nr:MAG: hypothetical protein A4E40_00095 [Methanoregulaceae archaeon PtaU1.Bin059]
MNRRGVVGTRVRSVPSKEFQERNVPFSSIPARIAPPQQKTRPRMASPVPAISMYCPPFLHIPAVPSLQPEAIISPWAATAVTAPRWTLLRCSPLQSGQFHEQTDPSLPPEHSVSPPGAKATEVTGAP